MRIEVDVWDYFAILYRLDDIIDDIDLEEHGEGIAHQLYAEQLYDICED